MVRYLHTSPGVKRVSCLEMIVRSSGPRGPRGCELPPLSALFEPVRRRALKVQEDFSSSFRESYTAWHDRLAPQETSTLNNAALPHRILLCT